ncbi:MAG: EcsC family protein [Sulfurovaceae bacterium]|nr:EcsC family protein [Sulfurovaceae bacterium]
MSVLGNNEKSEITESKMQQALNFAYDKAVNGVMGLDSAEELAQSYMQTNDSKFEQANSLIRWQNTKAGTSGFLTGLGGIILMPVTLPANITSVLYVQIRMIASIAHIGGYDVKDDKVKTLIFTCLVGNGAIELLKDVGIQVGKKVATNALKNISGKVITQINQKVGFRLVTKFGEKGVVNLGKAIPLFGGLIGGTVDVVSTNTIGNTARNIFITKK